MKFIDETELEIFAGDGGRGCVSFRREKFVPMGGPDGGDGGRGGDVIFKADGGLTTLLDAQLRRHIRAGRGEHGMGSQMSGRNGGKVLFKLPVGTIVKDLETGEEIVDLTFDGQIAIIAKGGKGGKGNMHFVSSTNQAPRKAQKGLPGERKKVRLELKLLADIGLVGFPNAGKSTLISVVSNARPKVADYPFTTKIPSLGVVRRKGRSFTVADIPGLIEGAHKGLGLGIRFLKHVERTKIIVHLIDVLNPYFDDPSKAYSVIRNELKSYGVRLEGLPEIIVATKIDIDEANKKALKFQKNFEKRGKEVLLISSATQKGLDKLLDKILEILQ